MKVKLGVNIDHVATIRNARDVKYPDPVKAALIAEKCGADSITIHLREDRRHIRENDLKKIIRSIRIPLNLEIAPTKEMLKIALKYVPDSVCIVPEKRSEITTEGGLDLNKKKSFLKHMTKKLQKKKIKVSLFIEPKISDVMTSKKIGSDCIEIHTGKYCNLSRKNRKKELKKIKEAAACGKKNLLEVHAGHGLTYSTTKEISKIKSFSEFNIGHFIISEAIFFGLEKTIKKFKNIIK